MTGKNLRKEGGQAEALAAEYLQQRNYRILERNFRIDLGEIDIIAKDGDTICFVEVKMRRTLTFGTPFEAIPKLKMQKLVRVAMCYLKFRKLNGCKARFDVVAVTPNPQGGLRAELLKNAFRTDEAGCY